MRLLHLISWRALAAAALTATVAAGCGDGKTTAPVRPVAAVRVTPDTHGLLVGETVRLSAVALDADGAELEGRDVTWRSERVAVATVDADGIVEGKGAGVVTIVARSEGREGRATIVVSAPASGAVATVTLDVSAATLTAGETRQLSATPRDAYGNALADRAVSWTTSNVSVATVSAAGVVSAVAAGTARVTATSEGKSAYADVTVTAAPPAGVASVTLEPATVTLAEGATQQLVATPRDAQGTAITGLGMTWTSSAPDVAQVGALGLVTGVRAGTATIKVSVHGKEATAAVTVTASYAYDLVYAKRVGDTMELFRLDVSHADAAPTPILPAGSPASQPRPSPDGAKVAFVSASPTTGGSAIWVANANGSGRTMLADAADASLGEPTWSPDGSRIAYVRTATENTETGRVTRSHVWVMNADGSNRVALTGDLAGNQNTPAWSPRLADGTERIAFTQDIESQPHVWTMRTDGGDRRQITTAGGAYDITPAWSPDGRTIAFQRSAAAIFGDIWLVDANGGNERALMPFYALPGPQWSPAFSPDGKLVAFISTHETYGSGTVAYQIYTVWADGSKLARRTADAGDKASPAWLPRP